MNKVIHGRPPKDQLETEFKTCVAKHLPRHVLEGKVLAAVYQKFCEKKTQCIPQDRIRNLFETHNQRNLYDRLQEVFDRPGTTVSIREIADFSSTKDVLYLLNACRDLLRVMAETNKRLITPRQLHLLLTYYLHKQGILTNNAAEWFESYFPQFSRVMRTGPDQTADATDSSYILLEMLVRWALELATHLKLSVAFPPSK